PFADGERFVRGKRHPCRSLEATCLEPAAARDGHLREEADAERIVEELRLLRSVRGFRDVIQLAGLVTLLEAEVRVGPAHHDRWDRLPRRARARRNLALEEVHRRRPLLVIVEPHAVHVYRVLLDPEGLRRRAQTLRDQLAEALALDGHLQ